MIKSNDRFVILTGAKKKRILKIKYSENYNFTNLSLEFGELTAKYKSGWPWKKGIRTQFIHKAIQLFIYSHLHLVIVMKSLQIIF